MGMFFFRIICQRHQQAAGHTQVYDEPIAAFQGEDQKFSPALHTGKTLTRNPSAKFSGIRVGDHFRSVDRDPVYGKSLYLRLDHPFYRFYFR